MDDEKRMKITEQFDKWCDDCQLYAVKFFIWNTEKEQLQTVIADAFETLPGKVSPENWQSAIRASLGSLPHCYLKDISLQIDFLLESPCKTDECQKECAEFRGKK